MSKPASESGQILSQIYEIVEDVIFCVRVEDDGDYVFQSINDSFLRSTALTRDQVAGRKVRDVIPEPSLSLVLSKYDEAISTGRITRWAETTDYPSGTRTGDVSIAPVHDDSGKCVFLVGTVHDITERLALEKSMNDIESKNKELEQFAYIASHDLQEPLRTIGGFVALLNEEYLGRLDETGRRYLGFMAQASEHMDALIKGLLDYSLIGKDRQMAKVDCRQLLDSVLIDLNAAITEANAQLDIGELPTIRANKTELRMLFQNLIANAVKFRRKDVEPRIEIAARREKGKWLVSVADNGIGISEAHKDRIFTIFQRLHPKSEYEGAGIGLAHCRKVVQLHGGTIWVESEPGSGSTFFMTFPD